MTYSSLHFDISHSWKTNIQKKPCFRGTIPWSPLLMEKNNNKWGLISKSYIFQMSITRIVALTLFSFLILVLVPSTFIPKMSLIPTCPPMPVIWEGRKCNEITEFGKLKSKQEKKWQKLDIIPSYNLARFKSFAV